MTTVHFHFPQYGHRGTSAQSSVQIFPCQQSKLLVQYEFSESFRNLVSNLSLSHSTLIHGSCQPSSSYPVLCHCPPTLLSSPCSVIVPRREAGDVWRLLSVWNLRAVIWFHHKQSSIVLLPWSVVCAAWFRMALVFATRRWYNILIFYFIWLFLSICNLIKTCCQNA